MLKEVTRLLDKKSRALCVMLALFMFFSSAEIIGCNNLCQLNDANVINRYSALVTIYDPITANSEMCTLEMMGNKNSAKFVRADSKISFSTYTKESELVLSLQEHCIYVSEIYISTKSDNIHITNGKTIIVEYIHNKDGEK